jgi:hypothetical protein
MTNQEDVLVHLEGEQRRAVERVVRNERKSNDHAWKWRFYRRVSWSIVAERLRLRLQQAADAARMELPWEHLYVQLDARSRSVSMWFGQHPLPGIVDNDLEVGASMIVSQDPRGGVVVLFFPFESLNLQQSKPKIIWGYFDGPALLTEKTTRVMVRDFLRYGRATSGLMALSSADRRFVELLEERSRTIESKTALAGLHPWTTGTLVLGSLATLALFLTWLNTGDGNRWEPWTGIVALLTGWVAAGAQKVGKTRDDARARALIAEGAEKAERDRRLKEKQEIRERHKKVLPRTFPSVRYKVHLGHGSMRQHGDDSNSSGAPASS